MAGQENGWPLGLRHPHNLRIRRFNGSLVSFDTLLTASPTSTSAFSSDLDTQSTGSFLRDNSITLGSLMGISNFLELSRRSSSTRRARQALSSESGVIKSKKTWLFSLCYRLSSGDEVEMKTPMAPSLGYLLEVERRASARFYGNVAHPAPHSTSHYRNAHLSLSYLCGYFCH